ncbi:MAG: tryptophanase [Nanoarchaeota archaeon]|nr:tryptophanase [Nanoarchaeota archaeon]
MKQSHELGVPVPSKKAYVVRNLKNVSGKQREYIQKKTEYNVFSFPAGLLTVDYLSDSGTTSMTDRQWAAMMLGDESYGRNTGYFCLLEAVRDIFERGDMPSKKIDMILTGEKDTEKLMDEFFLEHIEGGFANGGRFQLIRPNAFILPQGRCAEHVLFGTISRLLFAENPKGKFFIPSNGHFDTTEANIHANRIQPVNLFSESMFDEFPVEDIYKKNPFKGDMDVEKLKRFIEEKGADKIPMIYLTITNNTGAGQPVSLKNMKAVRDIADEYDLPLFYDACRFAENAMFIKEFEDGYSNKSIPEIVKEMFSYCDGFTISFKKDGLANMGGGLFFKDKGTFHKKFSSNEDIGVLFKEMQILCYGNDSYGGMSGRDIMALAVGLYEVVEENYLKDRIGQVRDFAYKLAKKGVPVILPPGGHAVYIDTTEFFEGTGAKIGDFKGVGLTLELIRLYGIRACELGAFAFEWDKKTPEERKGILNFVRFAVPRNAYGPEHIDYTVAAVAELYKNREKIPSVEISRGQQLRLRHFQSGLKPKYL